MPLYWQRLLKDIRDLTTEQIGAYVLLLGYQWEEGAIPADIPRLAVIAKLSPVKMRAALAAFAHRFTPHASTADTLANPFMERVREEQRAKFEKASKAGKIGAAARHNPANATSNRTSNRISGRSIDRTAYASPNDNANATADIENKDHHLASLGDGTGAREREKALAIAADADTLADYLLDAAVEHGFQMGHYALDRNRWHHGNREYGLKLIEAYDLEPCKVRALALVLAIKNGKITSRQIGTALLFKCWNYRELTDVVKAAADAGPSFDEMMGVA